MIVEKEKVYEIFDGSPDQPDLGLGEVSKRSFDAWYALLGEDDKKLDMVSLIEHFAEDIESAYN